MKKHLLLALCFFCSFCGELQHPGQCTFLNGVPAAADPVNKPISSLPSGAPAHGTDAAHFTCPSQLDCRLTMDDISTYGRTKAIHCDTYYLNTLGGDVVAGNFVNYYVNGAAAVITSVAAHTTVAATGSDVIIDINVNGATILGTPLHIDATTQDSAVSVTPATIASASVAANDVVSFDYDQADSGNTAAGGTVRICEYNP